MQQGSTRSRALGTPSIKHQAPGTGASPAPPCLQWCEDNIASLPSSLGVHPYYDDFTTPCYDGKIDAHTGLPVAAGCAHVSSGDPMARRAPRAMLLWPLRCKVAQVPLLPCAALCRRAQRHPWRLLHLYWRRGQRICEWSPLIGCRPLRLGPAVQSTARVASTVLPRGYLTCVRLHPAGALPLPPALLPARR